MQLTYHLLSRAVIGAVAFAVLVAYGPLASADKLNWKAKRHLDRGAKLFEKKQYDEAVAEFQAGYAIDPDPQFLYALGQAERLRGDCRKAIEHYERFLDESASPDKVDVVKFQIDRCRASLEENKPAEQEPEKTPEPEPEKTVTPIAQPSGPVATKSAALVPWYRDWIGVTLTGTGTLAFAGGVTMYVIANRKISKAQNSFDDFSRAQGAVGDRRLGAVIGVAGAGLIAAGVYRYLTRDRSGVERPAPATTVGAIPQPGGAVVTVEGLF